MKLFLQLLQVETLKNLKVFLTATMSNNFKSAIDARNKENMKSEFTFIGIKESSVEKYEKVKDPIIIPIAANGTINFKVPKSNSFLYL